MAEVFDLNKFIRIVGMTGSAADGECLNAIHLANAMLQAARMTWSDVLNGEDHVAVEACKQLLADLEAAHARIVELERQLPDWQPVVRTEKGGNHRRIAQWLLDLNAKGDVWLSDKERDFIGRCQKWIGPLRPAMQPWFEAIVVRTARRTGLAPPP
jgi:hypothetical protein